MANWKKETAVSRKTSDFHGGEDKKKLQFKESLGNNTQRRRKLESTSLHKNPEKSAKSKSSLDLQRLNSPFYENVQDNAAMISSSSVIIQKSFPDIPGCTAIFKEQSDFPGTMDLD